MSHRRAARSARKFGARVSARLCVAAIVVAACSSRGDRADDTARATQRRWVAEPTGVGPVKIGMSAEAARAALGASPAPDTEGAGETCDYLDVQTPYDVAFMIENDTVVRYDVRDSLVKTAAGVGLGATEARVESAYAGRVQRSPHKYRGPQGHYLTVTPTADSLLQLIFETDGERVTTFRAGRLPAVAYVEGCS